ncbi:A disintegrin and metalloproteinase with thrombospondin motifs 16-like [Ixodes scapularis]|uniref:A disintegrin and metalloproteinase with thrombospondin motifs 16-like n=1 Tax=Ixodes scapularis TaxID=6945 RepID=UPI001A9DD438|nr:A disintegrin and metalloproteinase with thrombospondin motifs 16-like [Ixodes scapularis]
MLEVFRVAFICAIICVDVDCAHLPEHIVYPKLLEARGINGTKLLHIRDGLTLRLEKISVLADSLVFTGSNDGVNAETIMNGTELEHNLYQDREKMAAVAVEEIDDTVEVMGVLNEKLRIAPLPLMARSEEGHLAHRIYGVESSMNPEENDNVLPESLPEEHAHIKSRTRTASMEHVPDQFLVEVHVMVDEHHYKVFSRREDLVTYLALTIVLVNMRFKDTSGPNIQFLLTSIQQEQGFAQTFVEYDIGWPDANRTYADANTTFKNVLEKYGRSPADITVAVTGLILADNYEDFSSEDAAVKGQARLGGVCNANYSILMVEDVPMSFGMVSLLPHELGHALGAPHDGKTYTWNKYLPPRRNCRKVRTNDHFIMHPSEPGNRKFSNCSREHMTAFMSTLSTSCFELKTKQNCTTEVKELPGVSINLTQICQIAHPNFLEWKWELTGTCRFKCCSRLSLSYDEETCGAEHILPDGADCGRGKRCVRGTCGYYDEHGAPTSQRQGA